MANRRMFAKTIIDSDAFLDMPVSTQLLYFHLAMRADDDGFINKPKAIMRLIGSSHNDIELLCREKFIIPFESGIVVIKHWKIHNYIRKDCYTETNYKEEKAMLGLDENDSYTLLCNESVTELLQDCDESVTSLSTQVSKGKVSKSKDNNNNVQNAEAEALFDELWLMYPSKKGKGQVSMTAKKKLLKIGADEMRRAIVRYKDELAKDADWRKPQNGSTFFNSGYVDYLDDNYQPAQNENDNFYEMAAQWAAE